MNYESYSQSLSKNLYCLSAATKKKKKKKKKKFMGKWKKRAKKRELTP